MVVFQEVRKSWPSARTDWKTAPPEQVYVQGVGVELTLFDEYKMWWEEWVQMPSWEGQQCSPVSWEGGVVYCSQPISNYFMAGSALVVLITIAGCPLGHQETLEKKALLLTGSGHTTRLQVERSWVWGSDFIEVRVGAFRFWGLTLYW